MAVVEIGTCEECGEWEALEWDRETNKELCVKCIKPGTFVPSPHLRIR
jgi:hypothetical protein